MRDESKSPTALQHQASERIESVIKKFVPQAELLRFALFYSVNARALTALMFSSITVLALLFSDAGSEIAFRLPLTSASSFPTMLDA